MTLIVQNDLGDVIGANSYVDLASYVQYFENLNIDLEVNDDEALEATLIRASRYVDSRFSFRGSKLNGREQSSQWPRDSALDNDGNDITGIPFELKNAVMEYAYKDLSGSLYANVTVDETGNPVKEKSVTVGPITETVKYADPNGVNDFANYKPHQVIDGIIRGLVRTNSGRVIR